MPRTKTSTRQPDSEYARRYRAKRLAGGGRRVDVLLSQPAADAMDRLRLTHGSDAAAIEHWLVGSEPLP